MALSIAVLFISFIILLAAGTPISIAIGISSVLTILSVLPVDISAFIGAQKMANGMDNFSLLAIPFFFIAGSLMNHGGIALRLVNLAKLIAGKLPGSLAQVNAVGNMLFGSISGSAVASAAAIGGTLDPMQKKEGYDSNFSAAVNAASCPTGLIIPPSNSLIVYSLASGGTSIAALFIAGYLPGILMGLGVMAVALVIAKKNKYPTYALPGLKESLKIIWQALPSLMLIVIVIGGIVKGIFTATEGAAIAVVYTFILTLCYRTLTFATVKKTLVETVSMTGIIMFLVGASSIMSWAMAYSMIPGFISETMMSVSTNPIIIMLLMNIVLLICGTFMDITPALLIFTPIFLPIARSLGVDPIHFGIIIVFNLSIGIMTPPVGSALFVSASVAKVKIEGLIKALIPFFIVCLITLLMVTYIPWLSLALPKYFGLM